MYIICPSLESSNMGLNYKDCEQLKKTPLWFSLLISFISVHKVSWFYSIYIHFLASIRRLKKKKKELKILIGALPLFIHHYVLYDFHCALTVFRNTYI